VSFGNRDALVSASLASVFEIVRYDHSCVLS
jgi:hypothetical protein